MPIFVEMRPPTYFKAKLPYPRRCKAAVLVHGCAGAWQHCNAPTTAGIRTYHQDTYTPRCEEHMPAELKEARP